MTIVLRPSPTLAQILDEKQELRELLNLTKEVRNGILYSAVAIAALSPHNDRWSDFRKTAGTLSEISIVATVGVVCLSDADMTTKAKVMLAYGMSLSPLILVSLV